MVSDTVSEVASSQTQRFVSSSRSVDGIEQVRAGHIDQHASGPMELRGKQVVRRPAALSSSTASSPCRIGDDDGFCWCRDPLFRDGGEADADVALEVDEVAAGDDVTGVDELDLGADGALERYDGAGGEGGDVLHGQ